MGRPTWAQEPLDRGPRTGHTRISASLAPEFLHKLGRKAQVTSASFGFKETPEMTKQRFKREVAVAESHISKTRNMSYAGGAHNVKPCPPGAGRRPASPHNRRAFRCVVQESMEDLATAQAAVAPENLDELARLTINFSSERGRLPRGTTEIFYGAATSRVWPSTSSVATPDAGYKRRLASARQYDEPNRGEAQGLSLEVGSIGEGGASKGGFDAGVRLPSPTSPRSGFGGVPGLRKNGPVKLGPPRMQEPMNPLWKDSGPRAAFNRPFSSGAHWHLRPSPRKICA